MSRVLCFVSAGLIASFSFLSSLQSAEPADTPVEPTTGTGVPEDKGSYELSWQADYLKALDTAVGEKKQLLVFFTQSGHEAFFAKFESGILSVPDLHTRFEAMVRVKVPTDARVTLDGKEVELLKHAAFAGLAGGPGLAVIDFVNPSPEHYGRVSGTLPVKPEASCTPRQVADALGLSVDLFWYGDYQKAMNVAVREGRMMLVLFCPPGECQLRSRFELEALADQQVRAKLADMVKVRLPLDAKIVHEGREVELLKDPAFAEMLGLPGLSILDFVNKAPNLYGHVVSAFPFLGNRVYTTNEMRVILDLPSGTLTQRTLIYAVRVHPERPASTQSPLDVNLVKEAQSHSEYQARILRQGHHFWENRFQRINARLPAGALASEVCAESWPGQGLLQAALECVRCWRLSSGHWSAVRSQNQAYGYDMKRGANGIWYATGIFGR